MFEQIERHFEAWQENREQRKLRRDINARAKGAADDLLDDGLHWPAGEQSIKVLIGKKPDGVDTANFIGRVGGVTENIVNGTTRKGYTFNQEASEQSSAELNRARRRNGELGGEVLTLVFAVMPHEDYLEFVDKAHQVTASSAPQ